MFEACSIETSMTAYGNLVSSYLYGLAKKRGETYVIETYEKTNTLSREMADGVLIQWIFEAGEQARSETGRSLSETPVQFFVSLPAI